MYAIFARGKFLPSPWCNHHPGRRVEALLPWDASIQSHPPLSAQLTLLIGIANGLDSARP
ncbi:hypothetical protein M0657_006042 [Pyricularia oryzae]|uniref:Uncharacterized protein n=3 Tax=Pyricularia oryzae TaxID=318829 RepID=A0A4V1C4T2_PYROR|nr:hypothetical protein OOU_Y34scaffold00533g37 [Pyricularia oryzae Y34]KAI7921606.1 hypothetical protein M0657_006042 [Pyricularia oryzae]KAI7927758.1 hypothetical protein M9X92_002126 [Pyricularia oryzae]QBZ53975.1 hypothetical protein PoMZ_09665 [Pyricularia oryzae]